jgi:hypothetical protein
LLLVGLLEVGSWIAFKFGMKNALFLSNTYRRLSASFNRLMCFILLSPLVFAQEEPSDEEASSTTSSAAVSKKYLSSSEWEREASLLALKNYQDSVEKRKSEYLEIVTQLEQSRIPLDPKIEKKHEGKGFVLFYPAITKMVIPREAPTIEEISVGKVSATLAADEWESAQFGVWAIRDLSKVSVRTSPLKQKGGSYTINDPNIRLFFGYPILAPRMQKAGGADGDINLNAAAKTHKEKMKRAVSGWDELPIALLDLPSLDLKKNLAHVIWINVYAPQDAPGGEYEGTVTLLSEDQELAKVPLNVTVHPFILDQAKEWGRGAFVSKPRSRAELIQMKEYGMNMVSSWWAGPDEAVVLQDGKIKCDYSLFTNYIKLADEVGYAGPHMVFLGGSTPKIQNRIFEILKRPLVADARNKTNGSTFEKIDMSPPFENYYVEAVRQFHQQMKAIGHADLPVCLMDEPDHEPRPQRLEFYLKVYDMVEKGAPEVPTYGVFYHEGDEDKLSHHHTAWCTNQPKEKNATACKKAGKDLWTYGFGFKYNGGMDNRFTLGVIPWTFGAKASLFWANYWCGGDPMDPWSVKTQATASIYTPVGPVSTPALAAIRENIDDGRYIRTLEKLIQRARSMAAKELQEEAKLHANYLESFREPLFQKLVVRGGKPNFSTVAGVEVQALDGSKFTIAADTSTVKFAEFLRQDLAARITSLQSKMKASEGAVTKN